MPKERPRLAVSEKTAFHRRLLLEKLPVSAPCDELRLKPTAFYRWHKEFFENGVAAFDRGGNARLRVLDTQDRDRQAKLARKDQVNAEVLEAHKALKRGLDQNPRSGAS